MQFFKAHLIIQQDFIFFFSFKNYNFILKNIFISILQFLIYLGLVSRVLEFFWAHLIILQDFIFFFSFKNFNFILKNILTSILRFLIFKQQFNLLIVDNIPTIHIIFSNILLPYFILLIIHFYDSHYYYKYLIGMDFLYVLRLYFL